MKGLGKRRTLKYILILSVLLMLFSPLYMYFSHNVAALIEQYPHLKILENKDVKVEIRPGKPSHWVPLKSISRYGKWAIVVSEDWAFYQHQGVDLEQMKVALEEMMEESRFRGASTITQQMVKNVFLSDSRTVWRKLHEIILAQKVERVLTKDRILEVYLNSIEYGPGIYGIKSAASYYFKKSSAGLTARESAFLAMLLPSPKRYHISFKKKHLTRFAQMRIKAILKKMRMAKIITPEQYEAEVNSRLSWER